MGAGLACGSSEVAERSIDGATFAVGHVSRHEGSSDGADCNGLVGGYFENPEPIFVGCNAAIVPVLGLQVVFIREMVFTSQAVLVEGQTHHQMNTDTGQDEYFK